MDLSAMTGAELDALIEAATKERADRRALDEVRAYGWSYVHAGGAPARVLGAAADALGLEAAPVVAGAEAALPERPGREPWTQPAGAHDAYRQGAEVTHDGRVWVNLTPFNTWEPGVSGWRLVAADEDGDPTGDPVEWVRPSGTHDAYKQGDRVLFEGHVYESIHDGANTWSPTEYPAAWRLIEELEN